MKETNAIEKPKEMGTLLKKVRNPFWMAPLSGITEICFREFMDEMRAGVLISELVSAKGLVYNSERTQAMIRIHKKPGTIVGIQLFGETAEDIIEGSRYVEAVGADFLDINLGCPVKKVVKKGCGSALLRDPDNLERFLSKIKSNIKLPLTCKMRTGWDHNELTVHECVRAAYNAGCEWAAIHGRTRAQGYQGESDWKLIKEVQQNSPLPIIGNGDIRNSKQAIDRLEESGVAAVMIGRGALRNPWIFMECEGKLESGHIPDRIEKVSRFFSILEGFHDSRHVLIYLRKLMVWLAFGLPGASSFRGELFTLNSAKEVYNLATVFFAKNKSYPVPIFENQEAFMMGGHG
jgi:tRNA-dihydrouridine synthase B